MQRLDYFPGETVGIWQACAELMLMNSCWALADPCVAMDVYHLFEPTT